jgi:ribose transport system ATP-binding protein
MSAKDDNVLLTMKKIDKSFPAVHALKEVDFELRAAEIHVLLGENGAGKSTLIKILSGAEPMDAGAIHINGAPVDIRSPLHAKELGICTVYQEFMLIPQLTVAENIHLGIKVTSNGIVDWKAIIRKSQEVIDRLGFEIDVNRRVEQLGVHEQQVVEIAKALAIDAKILILDEPSAALTDKETERLFEILNGLRKDDVGIVYISHNLEEVKRIGDRATVLRDGGNVATVNLGETSIEELPKLMVGEAVKEPYPKDDIKRGDRVLKVTDCSDSDGRFKNVNFELHAGEIISFAGLLGSGDEAFVRSAMLGIGKRPSGEIQLFGEPYEVQSPHDAIEKGIFYLPADRKSEGLILPMSVQDNATLAALDHFFVSGRLSLAKQTEACEFYKDKLDIRTPSLKTRAVNLSGGNQQKVMIARALSADSKIIIFNEPTRGVDIKGKVEIYKLMNQLAEEGAGVIIVSQELSETVGMSDRILIWRDGEVITSVAREDANKEMVLSLITGA